MIKAQPILAKPKAKDAAIPGIVVDIGETEDEHANQ
jgi:hypothetical protein